MDQTKLIDECRNRLHVPSDYALAKLWGLSPQHISQYRKGQRFDDYALCRVAETLDLDPRQLIAQRELSKEPRGERRLYWETLLKKLFGAASVGAYIAALSAMCDITPNEATPVWMLRPAVPNKKEAPTVAPGFRPVSMKQFDIMSNKRRRALRALRALLKLARYLPHPLRWTAPSGA